MINNGLLDEEKSRPQAQSQKLTFIDGSAIETKKDFAIKSAPEASTDSGNLQLNWNNEDYLNDIRRQIRKEIPNIEKAELEKIVKQFESQDVISITPFSATLSYTESPVSFKEAPDNQKGQRHETTKESARIDDKKSLKKVKKIVKKTLKNRTYKESNRIDFKMVQSQPDVSYESSFSDENLGNHLEEGAKYDPKSENCTSENDEMNTKILNQINSLLEQQFRSLKDELKANRSTESIKQSDEQESSPSPLPEPNLDAALQTKIKTSYIPENQYNIERVNGVRRVINRPFVNNIINQKKFQSVFKPAPIEVDDSLRLKDDKKHESTDDEPVSNSNQVFKQSSKKKTDKLNLDFQDEDGKLGIGDYDSLY